MQILLSILCLKDMDSLNAYFNNLKNKIIQGSSQYPIVRAFGHPFMILPDITLVATFLTDTELRQLHRRFGHPSVNRLIRILERSGYNDNNQNHRKILEKINNLSPLSDAWQISN